MGGYGEDASPHFSSIEKYVRSTELSKIKHLLVSILDTNMRWGSLFMTSLTLMMSFRIFRLKVVIVNFAESATFQTVQTVLVPKPP